MLGRIIGIIISVWLIWGGLSGEAVLIGTNSSTALIIVGCIFLIVDLAPVLRAIPGILIRFIWPNLAEDMEKSDDESKHNNGEMNQDNKQRFSDCLEAAKKGDVDSQSWLGYSIIMDLVSIKILSRLSSGFRKQQKRITPKRNFGWELCIMEEKE